MTPEQTTEERITEVKAELQALQVNFDAFEYVNMFYPVDEVPRYKEIEAEIEDLLSELAALEGV